MSNARSRADGGRGAAADFGDLEDARARDEEPSRLSPFAPGAIFAGRYRLCELLGSGAHSVVWEVEDVASGARLALKLLPAVAARTPRAELEAEIGRGLSAPYFPALHAAGTADGFTFIAMERLVGEDLAARLDRDGKLPREESVRLAIELGAALGQAHALGLIHRDLKPTNIFLSRDASGATTKVLDFGIAKRLAEARGTASNAQLGTPHYSAPEQIEDPRQVDHRADVWSMAAVLYRCLLGVRPFDGSGAALITAVRRARPALPTSIESTLSSDVDLVLLRGLARNKRDRFASAADLAEAFARALRACRPGLR
jgi:eukaryotic-like serine/threonine-protein kinase